MILAREIMEIPEFYGICPKNEQISRILQYFCPKKMPEFYIIIARKIFIPIFFPGGTCPYAPCPPSPTPILLDAVVSEQ